MASCIRSCQSLSLAVKQSRKVSHGDDAIRTLVAATARASLSSPFGRNLGDASNLRRRSGIITLGGPRFRSSSGKRRIFGGSGLMPRAGTIGKSWKLRELLVEQGWSEVLHEEFNKPKIETLTEFLAQEARQFPVYPRAPLVFNAFNICPFETVKVVILGQDPYHGPGQAMGLSFSVPEDVVIPSSLLNIFKELQADLGCSIPSHGNLENWAYQGVLLLNSVLTVRQHQANSHANKGWEVLTDAAIQALSDRRSNVVFILWGNSAKAKIRLIDTKAHHVLKAAHPSFYSAHKGFFGCRHFSKANKLLVQDGILPINWQL